MRKGPRGATVSRQYDIKATCRWTFTADELRKRLSLPDDAILTVRVPGGADWSNEDLDLEEHPLTATASETRSKGAT